MSTEASEVGAEPSLASILNDAEPSEAPATETPPAAASTTTEPATERPRASDGKFAAKSTEAPPAAAQPPTEAAAPPAKAERPEWVSALVAMRKEAQAAKRAAAAAPQGSPPPDFFADPKKAVEEAVNEQLTQMKGQLFQSSLRAAKAFHREDYDASAQAFAEAAQRDSRLVELMQNAEDPGELIYDVGTQIRELSDVGGDILAYRGKVTAEAAAKVTGLETQLKVSNDKIAALERQLSELSTVGRSLNTTTSTRPVAAHEADDDDVRSIVRFGNKPK